MNAPKEFITAYIACALWTEEDSLKEEGADATPENITTYDKFLMARDCAIFWTAAKERIGENVERAGHDFWLSRNGHGTGFFDDENYFGEENASWLQELASAFGTKALVVGDDGAIHYE